MAKKNITYLGSFDDRVTATHNWNNLNNRTLNEILVSEMIFSTNSEIVINDGYIVNSPIFRKAILSIGNGKSDKSTPNKQLLISMIKNNYIKILTRSESLYEMVEKMSRENNTTFVAFKKRKDWKSSVQKLDEDIKESFIPWPKFDLSEGFIKLMVKILNKNPKKLNLSIDSDSFKKYSDQFQNQISVDNRGPRDKWEQLISNSIHKVDLMKIANRAYHYNFGMCLQEDNFKDENVFVNSIVSNLFLEKTVVPKETDCDFRKLNFQIPEKIEINDAFIKALRSGGELCSIHNEFLNENLNYLNGGNAEDLQKQQIKFSKEIIKFDKAHRSKEKNPYKEYSIDLSCGAAEGAAASMMSSDILIGMITGVATAALSPLLKSGIALIRGKYRYRGKKFNLIYDRRKATIDSYNLNRLESQKHTRGLSLY